MMRRLFFLVAAATLALALTVQGCAQSPATGRSFFTGGLSPEDEVRMGRQKHPEIVAEFGGAYDDPELQAYVDSVGQLLARTSELPQLEWHFTVLDSPIVNAFALPGGYVYITRGLAALASTEAELAGVLAHEIGHVTARHAAQRYGQSMLGTVAAIGAGVLLGSEAGMQAATGIVGLTLRSYSREQEFEADQLGVRYLSRTGHDTGAMASFLAKMLEYSRYEAERAGRPGEADSFDLMQTHPRTADRVQQAIQAAGVQPVADPIVGRELYLDKIDGVVYGDSRSQGFARGRRFSHPELGFTFEVPEGFRLTNTPQRVVARSDQGAIIAFDAAEKPSTAPMPRYIAEEWAKGVRVRDLEAITVNGLEAATAWVPLNTRQGRRDWRLVAIRMDQGAIYRFVFITPPDLTAAMSTAFRRTTYSFRRLSPAEAASLQPYRIDIYQVRAGDSAAGIASRMPLGEHSLRAFEVLNGLDARTPLQAGQRVKVVTR